MKRNLLSILLISVAAISAGQGSAITGDANGMVTVSSRGNDVRTVIHDLFSQLGKNYILDPTVRIQPLYLSLKGIEFEEALFQICKLAELKFDVQNGIFYVARIPKPVVKSETKQEPSKTEPKTEPKPPVKQEPAKGSYPTTVLGKRVTTRFDKIDLRDLIKDLARQTGLTIEVDAKVPKYKIDAYLNNTSLKYALDQVTQAANLRYRLTDRFTIEVVSSVVASVESGTKSSGH